MSNQSVDGFQGSQPFITDNEYKSLSLDQLRYILNQKKKTIKDSYKELSEKEKIIRDIRKLDKLNEKVKKGIDIKKKYKKKVSKKKKVKTFEEYFEDFIKNKEIPKDTPGYLRKALERAMYEHEQGIVIEKSALDKFAVKHVFEGIPGISPVEYLNRVFSTVEEMLKNNRNTKFKMLFLNSPHPKKLTTRNAVRDKQTIHNQWQKHIRIQYKAMFIKQTYLQYNR